MGTCISTDRTSSPSFIGVDFIPYISIAKAPIKLIFATKSYFSLSESLLACGFFPRSMEMQSVKAENDWTCKINAFNLPRGYILGMK